MKSMEASARETAKNREAESAWARRQWGQNETEANDGDDMGHTILGDVNNPAPVIVQAAPSSSLPTILAAAALAGLGGFVASTYAGKEPEQPAAAVTQSYEDQSVNIGLGRIDDYKHEGTRR